MQGSAKEQHAAAVAQQQAAIAQQTAQNIRDQAQALRDRAQIMQDAAQQGVLVPSNEFQMEQLRFEHTRQEEKMVFAGFVIVVIAAVIILTPIARAFGRRLDGKRINKDQLKGQLNDGTHDQLQRIEQSMDAMAIEIERISEGQRFTTKVLAGREEAMTPVKGLV